MTKIFATFLLFTFAVVSGCVGGKTAASSADFWVKKSEKKLGEGVECLFNTDKSYVLCRKVVENAGLPQGVDFVVYAVSKQKAVYSEKLKVGAVEWLDDKHVYIINQAKGQQAEAVSDVNASRVVIEVATGKKVDTTKTGEKK